MNNYLSLFLLVLCLFTSGCGFNFFGEEHVHLHLYGVDDPLMREFSSQLNAGLKPDVEIEVPPARSE